MVVPSWLGVSRTAVVFIGYRAIDQPDPNKDFQTATSFVYYNNGKSELGTFEVQNRQPLTYEEIPENIKQAVVAAENRTFWTDRGVSLKGMVRAAYVIARGGNLQGGSTITQQYIKIMYLTRDQTLTRKFKELFLAYKINREMSKEEILTDYLNTIYFGRGAYGIQSASQAFFDVDAKKLTVPQAAVLASVLNNPAAFDPSGDADNVQALLGRYRYVLQSMSETGAITPAQAAQYAARCRSSPRSSSTSATAGPRASCSRWSRRSSRPPASTRARSAAADSRSSRPSTRLPERRRRSRPRSTPSSPPRRRREGVRACTRRSPRSRWAPGRCWRSTAVPTT